jgi:hypothetical protein
MYYSDLIQDERLLYPVEPPLIQSLYRIYKSIKPNLRSTSSSQEEFSSTSPSASSSFSSSVSLVNNNKAFDSNENDTINLSSSSSILTTTLLNATASTINTLTPSNFNDQAENILYFEEYEDHLFIIYHQIDDSQWYWAQSCSNYEYGLLPSDCVRFVDEYKLHELQSWFYSNISKDEAARILTISKQKDFKFKNLIKLTFRPIFSQFLTIFFLIK